MVRSTIRFFKASVIQRRSHFLIVMAAFATLMTACNKAALSPLDDFRANEVASLVTAKVDFCTLDATAVKSKLKFVFVVDRSTSNQTLYTSAGTDPFGVRRFNPMIEFVNQSPTDDSVSFAMVNFADGGNKVTNGFITKDNFLATVEREKYSFSQNAFSCTPTSDFLNNGCPTDGGYTNYKDALRNAKEYISADIDAAKANQNEIVSSQYVVFFLTDGAPITGGVAPNYVYQSSSEILSAVSQIAALATGNEKYAEVALVNTLYYFNTPDPGDTDAIAAMDRATTLLSSMATTGSGQFVQISNGETIDFSKFKVPTRKVKNSLSDVYFSNLNTAWWDGVLMRDSDGDTLPDLIEVEMGSDPALKDSDGNGVSDGVEYRLLGQPCLDSKCSPDHRESFAACDPLISARYLIAGFSNTRNEFIDLDADGLNACEEKSLNSDPKDFDSNRDGIPDGLAFKAGISFVLGSNDRTLDPDGDGFTNYQELKDNTPGFYPNDRITGLKKYEYSLSITSNDSSKTCYHLDVKNISQLGLTDTFEVLVLENSSVIDNKRYLRRATARPTGSLITISKGAFQ